MPDRDLDRTEGRGSEENPSPDPSGSQGRDPPDHAFRASSLVQIEISFHAGQLPSPEQLAAYAEIVPDLPERLLRPIEAEQQHRHALEARDLDRAWQETRLSHWLGAASIWMALLLAAGT